MTSQNTIKSKEALIKPNILYVDDEEINLKVFKSTFKRHYNVFVSTSAYEAIDLLKEQDIQLIVTDQRMPEMNGTELLSKVIPNHPDILRMIMTGFSDLEVIIRAVNEFGIHQYITKPWDFDSLKAVFDDFLIKPKVEGSREKAISYDSTHITKYAEVIVNKRNTEDFDLIKKYFKNTTLMNHSTSCNGEKNYFIHEFKKGDAVLAFIASSSVVGIRGSMIKSFVGDMAKDLLLSKNAFNPVNFFRSLCKSTNSFLKDIEVEDEEINIQMIYKHTIKPSTWVLTNKSKILTLKDDKFVELPVHSTKPDEKLVIYRLDPSVCDKFYLYYIDGQNKGVAIESELGQRILDLNTGQQDDLSNIELQSYMDHLSANADIDKFSILSVEL